MPLNKTALEQALRIIFEDRSETKTAEQTARKIANAIDSYIKSATVTVASGIPVATAGSAASQVGATTAPGTGTLS
ncbi:MAG: hypothetical protein OXB93_01250 [Cytophagales bacterium]|nr:hypothetical protein [Cytophagales bacterium]